jgi:hypothetical protein
MIGGLDLYNLWSGEEQLQNGGKSCRSVILCASVWFAVPTMGTQKPVEWVSSLITRFEEQVLCYFRKHDVCY